MQGCVTDCTECSSSSSETSGNSLGMNFLEANHRCTPKNDPPKSCMLDVIFLELHFDTRIRFYRKFSDKTNYDDVKTNYLVSF